MTLRRLVATDDVAVVELDYDGPVSDRGLPGMPPAGQRYHRSLCCVLDVVGGHIRRERDYPDWPPPATRRAP